MSLAQKKFKKNTLVCNKHTGEGPFVILSNKVTVPTIDDCRGSCTGWHDVLDYKNPKTWKGWSCEGYVVYDVWKQKYSFMFLDSMKEFVFSNMSSDVIEGQVREFLGKFLLEDNLESLKQLVNPQIYEKFRKYTEVT